MPARTARTFHSVHLKLEVDELTCAKGLMDHEHEKSIGVCCRSPSPWNPCQGQKIVTASQPDFEKQKRSGEVEDGSEPIGCEEGRGKIGKEDGRKEVPCLCGRFGSEQKPANAYEIEEQECFYQTTHDGGLGITDSIFERSIGTQKEALVETP